MGKFKWRAGDTPDPTSGIKHGKRKPLAFRIEKSGADIMKNTRFN